MQTKLLLAVTLGAAALFAQTDGVSRTSTPLPPAGPAGTGDFFVFANGCPGSGAGLGTALSLNDNASTTQAGGNSNQFALKAVNTTSAPIVVLGFELWTSSISTSPITLTTELYDEAPSGTPNAAPIRTGTMVVGNKAAWYRTTFTTPHILNPGSVVFPSFLGNGSILHPRTAVGGTNGIHYWHSPSTTAWNGPFTTQPWAWRILTPVSKGARPQISCSGTMSIGQVSTIKVSEARPAAPALLFLGASNAVWGSISLPLDLTFMGAPGCRAHVSGELSLALATDPTGSAAFPLAVPNNAALVGLHFFTQWYIVDPAVNTALIVNSDAAEAIIG